MQKYYIILIKMILNRQLSSILDVYNYIKNNINLTKEASIYIIDALIDNQLLNYNFESQKFML